MEFESLPPPPLNLLWRSSQVVRRVKHVTYASSLLGIFIMEIWCSGNMPPCSGVCRRFDSCYFRLKLLEVKQAVTLLINFSLKRDVGLPPYLEEWPEVTGRQI